MNKSGLANLGSWLLVIPLPTACIAHGIFCYRYYGQLMCGNSYIDPVGLILSILTPVAAIGVGGLRFYGDTSRKLSIPLAAGISLFSTVAMLIFGAWLVHGVPSLYLSDLVWWLKPFRLVGL